MVENDRRLRKNSKICKTFKNYFVKITNKLDTSNCVEADSYYSKLTEQIKLFEKKIVKVS